MEWSKIKNILIIALLLTNILLIALLILSSSEESRQDSQLVLEDTLAILDNNGISISAEIPSYDSELPVLTLTYDEDNGTFYYTGSEEGHIYLSEEEIQSAADSFTEGLDLPEVKDNSLHKVNSYPSTEEENTYVVSYGNYYESYRLEDSYLICFVTPEGITKMIKKHASAEASGKSRQDIIPPTTALLKFMNQIKAIDKNSTANITDIDMIYKIDSPYGENITSDTAFPTWKITTSDGSITYISAYK